MSYKQSILAAVLCTMAPAATCAAQGTTTYGVVTTNQSTTGWAPRNVYVVDVNNDGIPDLIQDQYWASTKGAYSEQPYFGVSIGNGDGTFKPAVSYTYPPGAVGSPMAFGDFNGDGRIDIAMLAGNRTVAVYLGRGDGTFVNPYYSVIPMNGSQIEMQTSIVAADFNRDGKLDLAIVGVDNSSNTVYILQGEGYGLFSTSHAVLTVPGQGTVSSEGVQKMLLGDFDGDGNADLAVIATTGVPATGGIATLTTHVLYGNGAFGFEDTTPITSSNFGNVVNMNSGDLNGDGKTDLFALNSDSYRLETFYGESSRTFASYTQQLPSASYFGANFMPSPAMADFNDDGRNDLVTSTFTYSGETYLIFFLATSSPGQFTLQTWNLPGIQGGFIVPQVGDFNHDGKPDWVLVTDLAASGSYTYTGLNGTVGGLWADCDYPWKGKGIAACSPAGNSGPAVNFNATAHSFGQIRKMELWVDGKKLGEQYHTWEGNAYFNLSSTLAAGSHLGTYFATDVDHLLQAYSFQFTVPSSCSAPASAGVHICAPANGSTTSVNPILVQASATVTGTIERMEVWVDSVKKYTETASPSLAASLTVSPGKHTFTVFAVNTNGTVWRAATTATVP